MYTVKGEMCRDLASGVGIGAAVAVEASNARLSGIGRFVDRHSNFFAANPRMSVMVRMKEQLGNRMAEHHRLADAFLTRLHG